MSVDSEKFNRILKGLYELHPNEFMDSMRRVIYELPASAQGFSDALSIGQIKSKKWLVSSLKQLTKDEVDLGNVFVLAGWYGTLAYLLKRDPAFKIDSIVNVDIDPHCERIAERLNKDWLSEWRFKEVTMDIRSIKYTDEPFGFPVWSKSKDERVYHNKKADTIICTSCEHIDDWQNVYDEFPNDVLLVLQSNDLDIPEHINRPNNLKEFEDQTPMEDCAFSGGLELDAGGDHLYTRFMRIGYKK